MHFHLLFCCSFTVVVVGGGVWRYTSRVICLAGVLEYSFQVKASAADNAFTLRHAAGRSALGCTWAA